MRSLPERKVEVDGRPALVTSFESVDSHARLEVLHDRETFRLLAIHGV